MALARQIMQGGFSGGQARAVAGNIATAVSAAGTSITDATDLVASVNMVTTWAASAGVQLPAMDLGDEVEVINLGAGAGFVYPETASVQINALSAGTGFVLAPNTGVKVRKASATRCIGYLSA